MASSAIVPPLDYLDRGPGIVISISILAFITTIIVGFRLWSRKLTHQPLGPDDYLCVAALLTHHALMAACCVGVVQGGIGRDIRITATEDPHSVVILFQALFAAEIAYTYSSPFIKLSVLYFYWRVFPTRAMKLGCTILGSMCIAWCMAITVLNFVQCRPLHAFWYTELQKLPTTQCLDSILCFFSNSVANCIIDFFTLTLPIHEVAKLKTTRRKKIHICCVFLLGGLAVAASLVRAVTTGIMWSDGVTNFTQQFTSPAVATVVEIYAALIGACMPTMVPVYRRLRYGTPLKSSTTEGTSGSGYSAATPKPPNHPHRAFKRLNNSEDGLTPAAYHSNHEVSASRLSDDLTNTNAESYPMEGIMVTRDTVWLDNQKKLSNV